MKKLSLFTFLVLLTTTACGGSPTHVKLTVIDDDGQPVDSVKVGMGFMQSHNGTSSKGYTNANGIYRGNGFQQWGVRISLSKEGYYSSEAKHVTNVTNIVMTLRQKKNPVPMYCRHILKPFIKKQELIGFDLIIGDWVTPYGQGTTAHMDIDFDGRETDFWNYSGEMNIRFTNPNDGLFKLDNPVYESKFRYPYSVPQGEFVNTLSQTLDRTLNGSKSTSNETYQQHLLGYALRLNTEIDSEGNIVSTNYGLIHGDIYFSPRTRDDGSLGRIKLSYCYNPVPNQKSLEVSENLAKTQQ